MQRTNRKSACGRAAAAGALAVLLSSCGGDVVVNSGGPGGGVLPVEDRLSSGGGGSASRAAAAWGILGDGVGSGADRATLVTAAELAAIPAASMAKAALIRPRDGRAGRRHRCGDGACGAFDRRDDSGLWRRESLVNWAHAFLYADGGVTQSERGAYINDDAIAVALGHDDGGNVTYKVGYTYAPLGAAAVERWTLDSEASSAAFAASLEAEAATAPLGVRRWSADGEKGALFRASRRGAGDLWLAVTTDIGGAGDTDWLATGLWAWTPESRAAGDYRFGVFASGGDVFDQYSFIAPSPPTGRATYSGDASGVYSRVVSGTRANDFFEASATLAADFGSAELRRTYGPDYYGFLSGTVDGFTVGGESIAGNPTLTLMQAVVGGVSPVGNQTASATRMTFDGSQWRGAWGAQFFGNAPRDPGDDTAPIALPRSVAGTFGATAGSGDSSRTFIGAFAAHR